MNVAVPFLIRTSANKTAGFVQRSIKSLLLYHNQMTPGSHPSRHLPLGDRMPLYTEIQFLIIVANASIRISLLDQSQGPCSPASSFMQQPARCFGEATKKGVNTFTPRCPLRLSRWYLVVPVRTEQSPLHSGACMSERVFQVPI